MVINFNIWLKRALIIIISLIIVGCSVVTLGYNRLPFLTIFELDSIVDLTEEQENLSRIQLDAWLEWHREKHLPQYIVKLEQWEKLIIQDLTPGQFCKEVDVIRTFTNEAVEKFIPALIPIATTLTPAQIENWNKYQEEKDKEFVENFGKGKRGEIINEKRLKRAIERAEMLYGTLNTNQKEALAKRLEKSVFNVEQVLPERKRRHADSINAVKLIQSGAKPYPTLKAVWDRNQKSPNPNYVAYSDKMLQDGCSQLSELHNKTTLEQRKKAAQKLNGYRKDFESLLKS
jgi:hypothetical protein